MKQLGYLTMTARVNTNFFRKKLCYNEVQAYRKERSGYMAVYKDGDKWSIIYRFTDWKGERKQTQKRGFDTK